MKTSGVKKGVILAVALIAVIAITGITYSRYVSTATVNGTVDIAKWSIKLNDTDISTTPTTKNVVLTYEANEFVKDDTIAPGTRATFDVVLDPTGSEVAVDYSLNIDTTQITGITNTDSQIAVTGAKYVVDGQAAQNANITGNDVIINESLADVLAGKKVTLTVTVEWQNASQDAADTANGTNGGVITIPVTVTAEQHI